MKNSRLISFLLYIIIIIIIVSALNINNILHLNARIINNLYISVFSVILEYFKGYKNTISNFNI